MVTTVDKRYENDVNKNYDNNNNIIDKVYQHYIMVMITLTLMILTNDDIIGIHFNYNYLW